MRKAFYWLCFFGPILFAMLAIMHWDWRSLLEVLGLLAAGLVGFIVVLYGMIKLICE